MENTSSPQIDVVGALVGFSDSGAIRPWTQSEAGRKLDAIITRLMWS